MNRRGASTASKRIRSDEISASKTFPNARKKLDEILKCYSFCKVTEIVHVPSKDGRPSFYHGICTTIKNSRFNTNCEKVFFDKGGRLRYNSNLEIGPCKLLDAAWGREHSTSLPQIGDIIVGVLEDNLKQSNKLSKVMRGWSRNGKILLELSRIVEFGTSMHEYEIDKLLTQNECKMQSIMPDGSKNTSNDFIGSDDFAILAKIILWGNLRPVAVLYSIQGQRNCIVSPSAIELANCGDLKLSCKAFEFISSLSFKLEDPDILSCFMDLFKPEPPKIIEKFVRSPTPPLLPQAAPPEEGMFSPPSPPYIPSSPPYYPSSPIYAPSSPLLPPD